MSKRRVHACKQSTVKRVLPAPLVFTATQTFTGMLSFGAAAPQAAVVAVTPIQITQCLDPGGNLAAASVVVCSPDFLGWCYSHGVTSHGVAPGFVQQGWRGVLATQDLEPGHCIMCVPESLLMSGSSAPRDPLLAPLLQQAALDNHQVLCVHLLHEASKGPASFWHMYIQQLPPTHHTLCTWSPAALQALQLPSAVAAAQAAVQCVKAQWKQAWPALKQLGLAPKWCSWRAWQWASATVSSRTMYLPGNPAGALTPLGDLHNYQPPAGPFTGCFQLSEPSAGQTAQEVGGGEEGGGIAGDGTYDAEGRCYRLHARRRYAAGEEVFLCYGAYTNLELLELYGFLLPHNPHDRVLIPVELLPNGAGGGLSSQQCAIHADGHPTWELLRVLRVAAASPAEAKGRPQAAWEGNRISSTSEAGAASALAAACQQLLDSLPTTLEQDHKQAEQLEQQLDTAQGSDACPEEVHDLQVLQLALQWRVHCKSTLKACKAYCESVVCKLGA